MGKAQCFTDVGHSSGNNRANAVRMTMECKRHSLRFAAEDFPKARSGSLVASAVQSSTKFS
eukprot:3339398-Amphidinium_carterae.1